MSERSLLVPTQTVMLGHGVAAYFASPPPSLPRRSEGLATRKGTKKSFYRRACPAGAVFGPERAASDKHRSARTSRVVAKEGDCCPCSGPQTSLRRGEPAGGGDELIARGGHVVSTGLPRWRFGLVRQCQIPLLARIERIDSWANFLRKTLLRLSILTRPVRLVLRLG